MYANVTSILKQVKQNDTSNTYLLALLGEQGLGWNDVALGIILLIFSLSLLCGCLVALMKILNSMLGTNMAIIIQKTINAEIPYVPWLTGYAAMLLGNLGYQKKSLSFFQEFFKKNTFLCTKYDDDDFSLFF